MSDKVMDQSTFGTLKNLLIFVDETVDFGAYVSSYEEYKKVLSWVEKQEDEVPVSTPVLKSTGVRLRIENPIYEEGYRKIRGMGKKGVVKDPVTGKRYLLTGKACSQPRCQCDAWAEEIES